MGKSDVRKTIRALKYSFIASEEGAQELEPWQIKRVMELNNYKPGDNRLSWDEWKAKQKEKYLKNNAMSMEEEVKMKEYKAQLEAEREKRLAEGINHSDLKKKKKTKKDKKRKKDGAEGSSSESEGKKKRKKQKGSDDSDSSCSSDDSEDNAKSGPKRLSSFLNNGEEDGEDVEDENAPNKLNIQLKRQRPNRFAELFNSVNSTPGVGAAGPAAGATGAAAACSPQTTAPAAQFSQIRPVQLSGAPMVPNQVGLIPSGVIPQFLMAANQPMMFALPTAQFLMGANAAGGATAMQQAGLPGLQNMGLHLGAGMHLPGTSPFVRFPPHMMPFSLAHGLTNPQAAPLFLQQQQQHQHQQQQQQQKQLLVQQQLLFQQQMLAQQQQFLGQMRPPTMPGLQLGSMPGMMSLGMHPNLAMSSMALQQSLTLPPTVPLLVRPAQASVPRPPEKK